MMASTHILSGALIGLIFSWFESGLLLQFVAVGVVGGVLPDLDLLWEHRKTLHRPFQFSILMAASLITWWMAGNLLLLFGAVLFSGLAVHSLSEVLSQGKTMNPDLHESDRGIYNHMTGEWIRPRNVVAVASEQDLLFTYLLALPLLLAEVYVLRIGAILVAVLGTLNFAVNEKLTREILVDYDRYSEFIQKKLGRGPETT